MSASVSQSVNHVLSLEEIVAKINAASMENEITVFSTHAPNVFVEGLPLRIDGLVIMLCREGGGRVIIDLKEYEIRKDSLIFIQPRNYIQLCELSHDFQGHCIGCTLHIIEDVLPKLTDVLPILIHNQTEPVARLQPEDAEGIDMFYHFLTAKLNQPQTPFLKKKLLCVLEAALLELMDIQMKMGGTRQIKKTRKEELMAQFIISVSRHFKEHREVSFYAEQLCISNKHLYTIVKETSGRTAGEWIENYVVLEAKVLLRTTDLSIQEISQRLNFQNQSFFGKYFKNIVGISPTKYRKENQ